MRRPFETSAKNMNYRIVVPVYQPTGIELTHKGLTCARFYATDSRGHAIASRMICHGICITGVDRISKEVRVKGFPEFHPVSIAKVVDNDLLDPRILKGSYPAVGGKRKA